MSEEKLEFIEQYKEHLRDGYYNYEELPLEYQHNDEIIEYALNLNPAMYKELDPEFRNEKWALKALGIIEEKIVFNNDLIFVDNIAELERSIDVIMDIAMDEKAGKNVKVITEAVSLISNVCNKLLPYRTEEHEKIWLVHESERAIDKIFGYFQEYDGVYKNSSKDSKKVVEACKSAVHHVQESGIDGDTEIDERIK